MTWPYKKLGEVCEIVSGGTPKTDEEKYWGGDYFWATPKDLSGLNDTEISSTARKISKLGLENSSARIIPKNSVLLSSRAPIGLAAINTVPMATNQGFKNLIPNKDILNERYLYHWLVCNRVMIESMGVGATFKEVSKAIVAAIKLPLPPLGEQRRIAEQLDAADRILRLREQAITKLDQLAQSMYEELTLKSHTKTINLQELCEVRTGFAFKSSDYCDDGDAHIVRISDIQNGIVHVENTVKMLKKNVGKGERYKLHNNEILIAMSGATTGKVGLLEDVGDKFVYLNQRVGQFIIRDERKITREFLVAILNSQTYQKHILLTAAGAAQANISPKQLVDFNVRLPPIDELTAFSAKLDSSKKIKRKISSFRKIAAALVATLQQQSFVVI